MLSAFRPKQHATGDIQGTRCPRHSASFLLIPGTLGPTICGLLPGAAHLPVVGNVPKLQSSMLVWSQLDVAHPPLTDETETPTRRAISLIDAPSVFRRRRASSRSCVFTLENVPTRPDRTSGRRGSNSRTWGGNPVLFH